MKYTLKSIELKKVKTCKFASKETDCFEAQVWVDGVRAGWVSNDGNGGCNKYVAFEKGEFSNGGLADILDSVAVAEIPNRTFDGLVIKSNAETLINDLLIERECKALLRSRQLKLLSVK